MRVAHGTLGRESHLQVLSRTIGLRGVSSHARKECAKSNVTILKIPLVDDLISNQRVPNARTNFCLEVEEWMTYIG